MAFAIVTVKDLSEALRTSPGEAPLRLIAEGRALEPGFHVTEVSKANIDSIDCCGRRLAWSEAAIQILDSGTGQPMRIATLRGILSKAEATLGGLGGLPIMVDADPGGVGLRRYGIAAIDPAPGEVTVSLAPQHAVCKPAAGATQVGSPDCRSVGCCA